MVNKKNYQEILPAFRREGKVLTALADQKRQYILTLLCHHRQGMTVSAITKQMAITQPAVSHHLRILRVTQLVAYRKQGLESEYYLTWNVPFQALISDFQKLEDCK